MIAIPSLDSFCSRGLHVRLRNELDGGLIDLYPVHTNLFNYTTSHANVTVLLFRHY